MCRLDVPTVQDPRIGANLAKLSSVSLHFDSRPTTSGVALSARDFKKQAREILEEEGLVVNKESLSKLVMSVALDVRLTPASLIYAVELSLREPVILPRVSDDAKKGDAYTWRHQAITGVVFSPFNAEAVGRSLLNEALRQVGVFAEDWSDHANPDKDKEPEPEAPVVPEPATDKLKRIRAELEKLLQKLGVGDASVATIEKFDVTGTKVSFKAKITHRKKNPLAPLGGKFAYSIDTTVSGEFDVADKESVKSAKVCTNLPTTLGGTEVCVPLSSLGSLFDL